MKTFIGLCFCACLFLGCVFYAQAEFITKVVYFKPMNVRVDLTAKIQKIVEDTQELYADEMERNGFERKTFRVETRLGKPRVHIVNGKRNSAYYIHNTFEKVRSELPNFLNQDTEPWDKQDMIVVIIVGGIACLDAVDSWCGWGTGFPFHGLRYGGGVVIAANSGHFNKEVLFHEMGHAFGLYHKPAGAEDGVLDLYEARWLDKHYQFNRRGNDFTLPQFVGVHKMTALENDKVRFEVDATSNHGLHQAIIVGADILVVASDFMDGKNRDTITFEFNRHLAANNMFVELMDTRGNYVNKDFAIRLPARLPTKPEEPNPALLNVNVLMYTGAVSWMSLDDANLQSQMTKQLLTSKGIQAEIVQTEDAVRDWMLQTTSDGNVDVLILYGTLPISIYPPFNSQLDGSVAENWIESTDGNTILNHGDYFGFWAGGNQEELGDQNGVQALQAIMDISHITMWDGGLENNTPMVVTKDGKAVTPSLMNFQSDRAFHLDELIGDWFAEKVLASDTGTSQATRADPVIVRDGNRGRIGIVYQTFNEVNPKGEVVAELIANFLLKNNDEISLPLVEPTIDNDTGGSSDTAVNLLPTSVQSPNIGQLLKLFLKIANGKNVAGYQATVSFDTTALRYVSSTNDDFLPAGAYVLSPILTDNTLTLAATSLSGESQGDGTLATLTFEVVAVKASTVSLSDVLLTNSLGQSAVPQTENAEITEPTHSTQRLEDVNKDGVVNIVDLTLVASNFGKSGENAADVNADGVVNIVDLTLVAAAFGGTNSAPGAWHSDLAGVLTRSEIEQWLYHARQLDRRDLAFQRGLLILEQLLGSLTPKETTLLPNYPNPFNPETWIPYQLAKPTKVTLNIYTVNGTLVRTLLLGYQLPGYYTDKNQAAYWDGCNNAGEPVANGIYFYQLQTNEILPLRKMVILK